MGPIVRRRAVGVGIDLRREMPGERSMRGREVRGVVVRHRPDDRQLLGLFRKVGKVFTDPNAGSGRGDGGKFAADIVGGVGLWVPGVKLAGASPLKDNDA